MSIQPLWLLCGSYYTRQVWYTRLGVIYQIRSGLCLVYQNLSCIQGLVSRHSLVYQALSGVPGRVWHTRFCPLYQAMSDLIVVEFVLWQATTPHKNIKYTWSAKDEKKMKVIIIIII